MTDIRDLILGNEDDERDKVAETSNDHSEHLKIAEQLEILSEEATTAEELLKAALYKEAVLDLKKKGE